LLHKTNPTALRSSFADKCTTHDSNRERLEPWKCLEMRAARGFTAARSARIDLLFTMSDITPALTKAEGARIKILTNEL
jgi:hypothetical protein